LKYLFDEKSRVLVKKFELKKYSTLNIDIILNLDDLYDNY